MRPLFPQQLYAYLLTLIMLTGSYGFAQETKDDDYFQQIFLRYEDYIYKKNIKTALLHKTGWELSEPVLELNSGEQLKLSFDDLEDEVKRYKYTFVHCDALWKPEDILQQEYIDGFTDDFISDYRFSFNTIQKYTHYELIFPDGTMRPKISGNYLLIVYEGEDRDNLVLTKRFNVVEQRLTITATVKRPSNVRLMDSHQAVDFSIDSKEYPISNPTLDLRVIITQNQRLDNAIINLKPRNISGTVFDYDYDFGNNFSGGNEFRYFDIKSLKYNSERIRQISFDSNAYQVYLKPDERRTFQTYRFYQDINGRLFIKTDEHPDSDVESEYAWVHFFLPYQVPLIHGNLFISGSLTDWKLAKENMLKYNYELKGYEIALYLKQGFYNYQYLFLENKKTAADISFIEGTSYETENEYSIYVYCREPGTLYDKLIGLKRLNSLPSK